MHSTQGGNWKCNHPVFVLDVFLFLCYVFFLFRTASFSWNWEHFQARKSVFNLTFSLPVEKPHIKFVLVHRIVVGLDYYILLRIYFGWINTFLYGFLILPLPADFSSLNNRHKYFFSRGRLEFTPISIVLSLTPLGTVSVWFHQNAKTKMKMEVLQTDEKFLEKYAGVQRLLHIFKKTIWKKRVC